MKLILLRHAKSSWDDPTQDDHDRPLNARGRASAQAIGIWLDAQGHRPDCVACSTATRARETCDLVCAQIPAPPEITHIDGLYHASADCICREIKKCSGETLMVVGHNPGFADVAALLCSSPPRHPDFGRYPTAATLVLTFDIASWTGLRHHSGKVADFMTPRDLLK